jgi:peptide/nickel transport system permease protein
VLEPQERADSAGLPPAAGEKESPFRGFFKQLVKKPLGMTGLVITFALLFAGVFAPVLAPYGMNHTDMNSFLARPSAKFLLGADNMGRDILSRVIHGARISVIVGLAASIISTIISLVIGIASGYLGGKLDLFVQRVVDTWQALPQLIVMMVIISIIGPGMWSLIIVLGLSWGIVGSRIIRSAVIGIKENAYLKAAIAAGCSTLTILLRHILPNIMAPTIVLFTTRVPNVILVEASLSFLGFGIPPPAPSWGGMLSGSGRGYMTQAPWMVFWPGFALAVVVYGVNMLGDAVRDILDPRLRGGLGRYGAQAVKNGPRGKRRVPGRVAGSGERSGRKAHAG